MTDGERMLLELHALETTPHHELAAQHRKAQDEALEAATRENLEAAEEEESKDDAEEKDLDEDGNELPATREAAYFGGSGPGIGEADDDVELDALQELQRDNGDTLCHPPLEGSSDVDGNTWQHVMVKTSKFVIVEPSGPKPSEEPLDNVISHVSLRRALREHYDVDREPPSLAPELCKIYDPIDVAELLEDVPRARLQTQETARKLLNLTRPFVFY
jgi:hypothetical protein